MKVLNYKGYELFLCTWLEKPCFMASQIGEALKVSGRSVTEIIRNNTTFKVDEDYCIIKNDNARELRNHMKEHGKDRFFASAIFVYKTGIEKYINHMRFSSISNEIRDFSLFLSNEQVIDFALDYQPKPLSMDKDIKKEKIPDLPEYKQRLMIELYECVKETAIPSDIKARFIIDILENRISDSISLLKKWLVELKVYVS